MYSYQPTIGWNLDGANEVDPYPILPLRTLDVDIAWGDTVKTTW